MLILSRHKEEQIVVGEKGEIVLTIVDIRGDKVRIGIEAPHDIPVHRREVYDAIKQERENPRMSQTDNTEFIGD